MSCTERHIAKCHIVLSEADAKEMYWKVDGHPELLTFVWKIFCHSNILVTVIVMVAYGRFPNSIHLWNSLSYFNFQFMMSLTIWIWDIQHPLPREAESVYQHLYQFPLVFGRGHSFPLSWRPALRPDKLPERPIRTGRLFYEVILSLWFRLSVRFQMFLLGICLSWLQGFLTLLTANNAQMWLMAKFKMVECGLDFFL